MIKELRSNACYVVRKSFNATSVLETTSFSGLLGRIFVFVQPSRNEVRNLLNAHACGIERI